MISFARPVNISLALPDRLCCGLVGAPAHADDVVHETPPQGCAMKTELAVYRTASGKPVRIDQGWRGEAFLRIALVVCRPVRTNVDPAVREHPQTCQAMHVCIEGVTPVKADISSVLVAHLSWESHPGKR
jgi:hypothetical protein